MHKSAVFFGLSSVLALAGFVVACSSTTTTVTDDPVDSGHKEAGTTKDSGTTIVVDDSGTPTDPDTACGSESTQTACASCCIQNHQAGAAVVQSSVIGCICKGTGVADGGAAPCATECATTACAATPAQPDTACNTCLSVAVGKDGSCTGAVSADCTANADCVAEQRCLAQCQGKP